MTSISKNLYIYKLGNTVNKYNICHTTIKMKPVDVKPSAYIESSKGVNYQDPESKLVILLEYQNIKTFLQKAMFQV